MSSPAQILANQTNAALSTGPRTTEGKTASSQNALKFGLTSTQVVLPFEDPAEFEALETSIIEQINPANNTERLLTDDIVVARWKIRRNELAQKAWVANQLKSDTSEDRNLAMAAVLLSPEVPKFQKYAAADRRIAENTWKKLTVIQEERRQKEAKQAEARAIAEILKERRQHREELQNKPNPEDRPAADEGSEATPPSTSWHDR
jgi:hypothetical protein